MDNIETKKSRKINIRLPKNIYNKITEYKDIMHKFGNNKTLTEVLIDFIKEGLNHTGQVSLYNIFTNDMKRKNDIITTKYPNKIYRLNEFPEIINERDNGCICCHEKDISKLTIHFIDLNTFNTNPNNLILLCEKDKISLQRYTYNVMPTRKFIEWISEKQNV